ncbi:MAG: MFS transporter [Acidobacteriales bacterium]|nr:MFS transporter [Terriglobales bacterium]
MSVEAPERKGSGLAAFRHIDYRWMQAGRLLSIVSAEMQSVAVAWQVYELTHRALDLGYVGLVQFLPGILLALAAGHVADRFNRRSVLLICYFGYAVVSGLLFWQSAVHLSNVRVIFGILLLLGTIRAFSGPAASALMPQLVPAADFPNAVAWSSSIFMTATILGPAAGGLIYAWGRATAVYAVSIPLYVAALILLALVHPRQGGLEKRGASLSTALAGFRYVWQQKIVLGSISLDLFAVLLGGAVALLPIYADSILRVGPRGLGILRSAPAVGAALMAVLLAHRPLRRRAGATMLACVALFGAATLGFGLSRSFTISVAMLFITGAADMVSVIVRGTLVQISTPTEMRGRVSAVNLLFIGASNEFGEFESGLTAHWFGAVPAVVIGGIGTLLVVAVWAWAFPELRRVQSLEVTSA